jgi:hypothetical protein
MNDQHTYLIQRLCTKNDPSGNPRRVWVAYDLAGVVVGTFDEGHKGRQAVPPEIKGNAKCLMTHDISVTEYTNLLKLECRHN